MKRQQFAMVIILITLHKVASKHYEILECGH